MDKLQNRIEFTKERNNQGQLYPLESQMHAGLSSECDEWMYFSRNIG